MCPANFMAEQSRQREKERERQKREREWGDCRRGSGENKVANDRSQNMSFIISCGVPSSCPAPAACLCFFVCAKVNPWASISRNNLSNIKTFNTTNDNGPAELSDLVQPSPNALETFFIAPARNFFVMSYAAQAATFEPVSLLPTPLLSCPAVSSGHYAVY